MMDKDEAEKKLAELEERATKLQMKLLRSSPEYTVLTGQILSFRTILGIEEAEVE